MIGLAAHRPVPVKPEPGKIFQDGIGEMRPAAGVVDVLQTQQESAARLPCRAPAFESRADMPEMQIPGRARRKPGDDWFFRRDLTHDGRLEAAGVLVTRLSGIGYACSAIVVLQK